MSDVVCMPNCTNILLFPVTIYYVSFSICLLSEGKTAYKEKGQKNLKYLHEFVYSAQYRR